MRLGISSHTFAWAIGVPGFPAPKQPLDSFALVRKAAVLRVPVVQIADNLPLHALSAAELRNLKSLAEENRIQLEVGTAGIQRTHLLRYLEIARELGSPVVRTLLDANGQRPPVDECIAGLRSVIRDFETAGIDLAIENHDRFHARTLAKILTAVASPQLGICLDTANSLGCGEDIHTVVNELAPLVMNLHIKDFRVARLSHHKGFLVEGAPAGAGCLDVPALLSSLRDCPASTSAIVELWLSPDDSPERTIEREDRWAAESVQFVRKCLASNSSRTAR